MNIDTILRLLQNSGFHVLGMDSTYLYLEDPSCILRSFETFFEYAWVVILCITGLFLFGWAISLIRGAKTDYFTNLRSLIIMLGTISAIVPIVNMVWGDDLFARGCRTIRVSFDELNKLLDVRKLELGRSDEYNLYEQFDIYDSGLSYNNTPDAPYSDAPIPGAGSPAEPEVTVSDNDSTMQKSGKTGANAPTPSGTNLPTSASASGKDVIYTNPDGSRYRYTDGTRAWRNNNPGNIRYSDFSRRMGAIGEAGGFAVFPDVETGRRAIAALLRSDSYNNLTIAGAISRYAPPTENDTEKYHRKIEQLTGLSINRRMSDLGDTEFAQVVRAIQQIEGWGVGRVVPE